MLRISNSTSDDSGTTPPDRRPPRLESNPSSADSAANAISHSSFSDRATSTEESRLAEYSFRTEEGGAGSGSISASSESSTPPPPLFDSTSTAGSDSSDEASESTSEESEAASRSSLSSGTRATRVAEAIARANAEFAAAFQNMLREATGPADSE